MEMPVFDSQKNIRGLSMIYRENTEEKENLTIVIKFTLMTILHNKSFHHHYTKKLMLKEAASFAQRQTGKN